jgi:hypothetical protein
MWSGGSKASIPSSAEISQINHCDLCPEKMEVVLDVWQEEETHERLSLSGADTREKALLVFEDKEPRIYGSPYPR